MCLVAVDLVSFKIKHKADEAALAINLERLEKLGFAQT